MRWDRWQDRCAFCRLQPRREPPRTRPSAGQQQNTQATPRGKLVRPAATHSAARLPAHCCKRWARPYCRHCSSSSSSTSKQASKKGNSSRGRVRDVEVLRMAVHLLAEREVRAEALLGREVGVVALNRQRRHGGPSAQPAPTRPALCERAHGRRCGRGSAAPSSCGALLRERRASGGLPACTQGIHTQSGTQARGSAIRGSRGVQTGQRRRRHWPSERRCLLPSNHPQRLAGHTPMAPAEAKAQRPSGADGP